MGFSIENGIPAFMEVNALSTKASRDLAKSEGKVLASAMYSYFNGFKDVEAWLAQIPDQFDGNADAGLDYTELYFGHSFVLTPEGAAFAENIVANEMAQKLWQLFRKADGPIYWRERLEYETIPLTVIDKFQKDGSFYHPISDRMCEIRPWKCACTKAYCRVARASKAKQRKVDFLSLTRY